MCVLLQPPRLAVFSTGEYYTILLLKNDSLQGVAAVLLDVRVEKAIQESVYLSKTVRDCFYVLKTVQFYSVLFSCTVM